MKIQAHAAGSDPPNSSGGPLPSARHGSTPEEALDELTPPAVGAEPSSLMFLRISSGGKRIFLAVGPKQKNKAT